MKSCLNLLKGLEKVQNLLFETIYFAYSSSMHFCRPVKFVSMFFVRALVFQRVFPVQLFFWNKFFKNQREKDREFCQFCLMIFSLLQISPLLSYMRDKITSIFSISPLDVSSKSLNVN